MYLTIIPSIAHTDIASVVVVSLQSLNHDQASTSLKASAGNIRDPPSPAQWHNNTRNGIAISKLQENLEPFDYFVTALASLLRTTGPLEFSTPTGSWLSALIHMQVISSAQALDSILDVSQNEDGQRLTALCRLSASLESSRDEITRVQELVPGLRRSDYAWAFSRLEQLLEEIGSQKRLLKELLDNQFRTKSIDAAETTVREGRSAVSRKSPYFKDPEGDQGLIRPSQTSTVTVLAFIFIPMNLASSIFGMNVQEINRTGHSIWPFVYTAVALLAFSGLGFYFRHPIKRALVGTVEPFVRNIPGLIRWTATFAFWTVLLVLVALRRWAPYRTHWIVMRLWPPMERLMERTSERLYPEHDRE